MIALATMAGVSIGRSAMRIACRGEAPRSCAASSYSGPIEMRRARTMMSTNESENVICPIACAVVPSGMKVSRFTNTRKSATPMTISGVTSGTSDTKRDVPAPRPRQRVSPSASATPSGTVSATAMAASFMLWKSADRRSGSCHTERFGSCQYQRSDQPCETERERPSLKEKRIAMRIGTIDQTRYSAVKSGRNLGLPQGLANQRRRRPRARDAGAAIVASVVLTRASGAARVPS